MNKSFLPRKLCNQIRPFIHPSLPTVNVKGEIIDVIVPKFVRIGDLRVHAWFGVVANLAVDALLARSLSNAASRAFYE